MPIQSISKTCYLQPQPGYVVCTLLKRKFKEGEIAIPDGVEAPEPELLLVAAAGVPEKTDSGEPKYPALQPGDVIYAPGPNGPSSFYSVMMFKHNSVEYIQCRQGAVAMKIDPAYLDKLGLGDAEYPRPSCE